MDKKIYIYFIHLKKRQHKGVSVFFFLLFMPAVFVKEEPGISDCASVVEMYINHMC